MLEFDQDCAFVDIIVDDPAFLETFQGTRHLLVNQESHFDVMDSPLWFKKFVQRDRVKVWSNDPSASLSKKPLVVGYHMTMILENG